MSSLKEQKNCEDRNGTDVKPQEECQSKVSHMSQFLPTSRRIVQFSNGKVFGYLYNLLFQINYHIWFIILQTNLCKVFGYLYNLLCNFFLHIWFIILQTNLCFTR